MPDLPTYDDLFRVARDEALARNGALTRDAIERAGSDANILTAGTAAVGDELSGQLAVVAAGLYLDSAKGAALDRLVFDHYGLTRKPAAAALGSVQFTSAGGATAAFAIPAGTRLQTADGTAYVTTEAAAFPLAGLGPVTVAVRSVLAGAAQQAKVGTITSLLSQLTGAPGDLAVTNAVATAGAADEESDDSLRDRARRFFTTARRGTRAAIEAAALAVPGVVRASAIETLDGYGRPTKSAQLVVADAFTDALAQLNQDPPAYQTQSQVLASNVFAALDDVRGCGIFVDVRVAQVVLQPVQLGLRFAAGASVDAVALQARAAVVAAINQLAPGATLTRAAIRGALATVPGLLVSADLTDVISPAGDVVPTSLQAVRSTLALVLAVSMQPDRALQGSANPDAP